MSKATDTGVFSLRNKTGEGWTKKNKPHEKAIAHFRKNLPNDFRRYAYMPPKGYRCRRYDNVRDGDVPRIGETVALCGCPCRDATLMWLMFCFIQKAKTPILHANQGSFGKIGR